MCPQKFYLTTPIYYVNDEPHIGHAYTTILGDAICRFHRMFGDDVFFLTGLDEHGQKVQQAAEKRGKPPLEHCDEMAQRFISLWKKLNIKNDDFIRTTQQRHVDAVVALLQKCHDKGDIYAGTYTGWYCVPDERYFTEKDLGEDKLCPLCGRKTQELSEKNYFFRMSKYQSWLKEYIIANPDFIRPESRKNEILGFLEKPLEDLCISRSKERLSWGIPLPFDKDYVCYVWVDALINYISTIGVISDEAKFNRYWPCDFHLIGKDILTTHSVYWITLLKSLDILPPKGIFAHGWWLIDNSKMSKSVGNVIKPIELIDKYGVDSFRYFLLKGMTPGQDSSFNEELFTTTVNSDLADNLGNVLSRLHKMIKTYFDGVVPAPCAESKDEENLKETAVATIKNVRGFVEELKINLAIDEVMNLLRAINKYIVDKKPWDIFKKGDKESLGTVLYFTAEALRISAALLEPVIPEKIANLFKQLGAADAGQADYDAFFAWGFLKPGTKIGENEILFPKIVFEVKADAAAQTEGVAQQGEAALKSAPAEAENVILIDDFKKVELKTAEVLSAEKVKGADKLLHLKIKVGEETRDLVAGIAQFYEPEKLLGKRIVIVANLKPAKLRGITSQGMLLAAKIDGKLTLVTTDDPVFPSGASIS